MAKTPLCSSRLPAKGRALRAARAMTDRSRGAGLAAILLAGALVADAAQPQFWRIEGARDFLEGETQGLTVDSEGRVRLAPASRVVHDPEAPYVWCLAQDGKGNLFAGTGSEGKVF